MIALSRSACLAMICRNRMRVVGMSIAPSNSVSTKPLIDAIGVFNSCDTLATKSWRTFSKWRKRGNVVEHDHRADAAAGRRRAAPCRGCGESFPARRAARRRLRSARRSAGPGWRIAADRRCAELLASCGPATSACRLPINSAAARFKLITRSCGSTANTPSTMLASTASCSCPLRPMAWLRSSICWAKLANRFGQPDQFIGFGRGNRRIGDRHRPICRAASAISRHRPRDAPSEQPTPAASATARVTAPIKATSQRKRLNSAIDIAGRDRRPHDADDVPFFAHRHGTHRAFAALNVVL